MLTPLDLERRFGITGGNIFHGEMSLDQMFVMRPVAGLGALPDAGRGPVSVRLGRAPRRRRDGRAGLQRGARDAQGLMKLISSKEVYECGLFSVTEDHATDGKGYEIRRSIVRHAGSAVMMAVDAKKRILLVRQYRLPAGMGCGSCRPAGSTREKIRCRPRSAN